MCFLYLGAYFKANNFIRFNEYNAKHPHKENLYRNAINSTNIVLATVHELDKLLK